MGGQRSGKTLVSKGEVASVVPAAADGSRRRDGTGDALRGSRFLTPDKLRDRLEARARAEGFTAFGIASPASVPHLRARLEEHLAKGHHGGMEWLAEKQEWRADPRALWPDVKSIIMLGTSYAPDRDPMATLAMRDVGTISVYARMRDYHDVIKGRLKQIAGSLAKDAGAEVKVFVDTAPVMEKPLAAAAGLGWQGKHTVLVSRQHGSWLFLGAIFTTAELPFDQASPDHCGSCTRCLTACPTDAFPTPYTLDSRRCIAYLTIEHHGPIPPEFRVPMGNRIFGCDDCLAVCPWNRFASAARDAKLAMRPELVAPKLADLVQLDDAAFRQFFAATPVKRTGRDRFIRNVLIAIGNSGDVTLADHARARLDDPAPIVRGAAVWALSRLLPRSDFENLRSSQLAHEADASVRAEWQLESLT